MSEYTIWLTNSRGVRLGPGPIDYFYGLECTKIVNDVGRMAIHLPLWFDRSLLQPGNMFQIWRAANGGRLSLWNTYSIDKKSQWYRGARGSLAIPGSDMIDLLNRRIVAYYAGSSYSLKSADYADDMMKEIVDENFINPVLYDATGTPDTDRDISSWLSNAADLAAGPTLSRGCAWDNVLATLQYLADVARQAGNEVFFQIVPDVIGSNSMTWKFYTRIDQPGADHTAGGANQVVFALERGNMRDTNHSTDYREEGNYIYAGGRGLDSDRVIETATDSTRAKRGIFSRREGFAYALNQGTNDTAVQDTADSKLEEWRPVETFSGEIMQNEGCIFGRDWEWGDKVTAKADFDEFDCIIRRVSISLKGGAEKIGAVLEWEQ